MFKILRYLESGGRFSADSFIQKNIGEASYLLVNDFFTGDPSRIQGSVSIELTASGNITNVVSTNRIQGTANISISSDGAIKGRGFLLGSASIPLNASGIILGKGSLLGSATFPITSQGVIKGKGSLQGIATINLTASGILVNISVVTSPIAGYASFSLFAYQYVIGELVDGSSLLTSIINGDSIINNTVMLYSNISLSEIQESLKSDEILALSTVSQQVVLESVLYDLN